MGIVVIDAMWSPGIMKQAKKIILKEFGEEKEFRYLINTNDNVLLAGGNESFKGSSIIAHENCKKALMIRKDKLSKLLKDRALEFEGRVSRTKLQLKEMDTGSDEYQASVNWLELCERIADDFNLGYNIVLPDITFKDELCINMGDLTLELIYFGTASSTGDILVFVPEEDFLFTGDLFHYHHILPLYYSMKPDISRWQTVLENLSRFKKDIKYVVRNNGKECWTWEHLEARHNLISDIIKKVESADSSKLQFNDFIALISNIETEFSYVTNWEAYKKHDDIVRDDIKRIAVAIWKENHMSAFVEIKQFYENEGIEKALSIFNKLKLKENNKYYFTENEFNNFGYKLLYANAISNAIKIFEMNVELFPVSANVYDSLGEAYMKNGQKELAIKQNFLICPQKQNWLIFPQKQKKQRSLNILRKKYRWILKKSNKEYMRYLQYSEL